MLMFQVALQGCCKGVSKAQHSLKLLRLKPNTPTHTHRVCVSVSAICGERVCVCVRARVLVGNGQRLSGAGSGS